MNVALSLHLSVHVEYKSYAIKNLENVKDYIVWSYDVSYRWYILLKWLILIISS